MWWRHFRAISWCLVILHERNKTFILKKTRMNKVCEKVRYTFDYWKVLAISLITAGGVIKLEEV